MILAVLALAPALANQTLAVVLLKITVLTFQGHLGLALLLWAFQGLEKAGCGLSG
jgi:hypothetical protein